MTSSTSLMTGIVITLLLIPVGCQTLHADLNDAEMDQRIREHFHAGMDRETTRKKLYSMSWVEAWNLDEHRIRADIWPKKFLIFGGILDYYGKKVLFFRFGDDATLEEVVYHPTSKMVKDGDGTTTWVEDKETTFHILLDPEPSQ